MMIKTTSARAVLFIFITTLLDSVGFGIILPVLPSLIMEVTNQPLDEATRTGGTLLVIFSVFQFFCSPIIGNLSDRFGRRPVLLLSSLCFSIDYLLMAAAPTLSLLILGRAIAGVAGAVYAPASSYLADISPPEKRAQYFGMIGAAFGLGFTIGPAVGGLLGGYGTRAPFYAAAIFTGCNFIYGLLVLPESLPPERRRPFSWRRANPLGTFKTFTHHPEVLTLAFAILIWQVAHQVYPSVWSYYTIAKFNWTSGEIGCSLAYVGIMMSATQMWMTGRLVGRLGERKAAYLGLGFEAAGYIAYAFATSSWMIYVIMTFASVQGVANPAMTALLSMRVSKEEQGELQGGISSLNGVSMIVGPFLMTRTFAAFSAADSSTYFPGAPFILAAALATTCGVVFALGQRRAVSVTAAAESTATT